MQFASAISNAPYFDDAIDALVGQLRAAFPIESGYDLGTLSASLRGVSFGGTPKRTEEGARTNHDEEVSA